MCLGGHLFLNSTRCSISEKDIWVNGLILSFLNVYIKLAIPCALVDYGCLYKCTDMHWSPSQDPRFPRCVECLGFHINGINYA